jgi:hypothetical protein
MAVHLIGEERGAHIRFWGGGATLASACRDSQKLDVGAANFSPVLKLDDPASDHLSFWNLIETHVLTGIRRRHGVKLPQARSALEYVRGYLKIERPLIQESFQTDGRCLFVELYGELVNASKKGRVVMKEPSACPIEPN